MQILIARKIKTTETREIEINFLFEQSRLLGKTSIQMSNKEVKLVTPSKTFQTEIPPEMGEAKTDREETYCKSSNVQFIINSLNKTEDRAFVVLTPSGADRSRTVTFHPVATRQKPNKFTSELNHNSFARLLAIFLHHDAIQPQLAVKRLKYDM